MNGGTHVRNERPVFANKRGFFHKRSKHLLQACVLPPAGGYKKDATLHNGGDDVKSVFRQLPVFVEQRTV